MIPNKIRSKLAQIEYGWDILPSSHRRVRIIVSIRHDLRR